MDDRNLKMTHILDGSTVKLVGRSSCKKAIILCLLKPLKLNKMSGLVMSRLTEGSFRVRLAPAWN